MRGAWWADPDLVEDHSPSLWIGHESQPSGRAQYGQSSMLASWCALWLNGGCAAGRASVRSGDVVQTEETPAWPCRTDADRASAVLPPQRSDAGRPGWMGVPVADREGPGDRRPGVRTCWREPVVSGCGGRVRSR